MHDVSLLTLLCFVILFTACTKSPGEPVPAHSPFSNDTFYLQYQSGGRDPNDQIIALIEAAKKGPLSTSLRNLQLALLLEHQVQRPNATTFELNIYAAQLIQSINRSYALPFYQKAVHIANEVDTLPYQKIFHMLTNKAGIHQTLMQFDSALLLFRQAVSYVPSSDANLRASAYNNLGYHFIQANEPDSASLYFETALQKQGGMERDPGLYAAIRSNIARLDLEAGQYDKAIKAYAQIDSIYTVQRLPGHYLRNAIRMMQALERKDTHDPDIHFFLQRLLTFISSNKDEIDDETLLSFYEFGNDHYFNAADRDNQIVFRNQYRLIEKIVEQKKLDQLNQLTQSLLVIQESGFRSEFDVQQLRTEKAKLELRSARYMILGIGVTFILVTMVLVVYIQKRRQAHLAARQYATSEIKRKEMEARLLRQDLDLKKRDLTNVIIHNTQVHDSTQKVIEKLQEISVQKSTERDVRALLNELQSQTQVSSRAINLQANIDFVNEEFYEKLKVRFPNLTKSETELCGFLRINLSNKDISVLKNVEASSVKMAKRRLRKKLGILPTDDIYLFIQGI